ncbi:MAG: hypothetical protein ABI565_11730 [Vicinamibacteria bacterium]
MTLLEGSISLPGGYIAVFDPLTLSVPGSLDFSADWTSPNNDIDIAVADGVCSSDQLSVGACTFAGIEQSETLKPEQLTLALSAAIYTPLIGNFTSPTETISYLVRFTPSASASAGDVLNLSAATAARLHASPRVIPAGGGFWTKAPGR